MTQETISNLIYLYFIFSAIALIRWGCDVKNVKSVEINKQIAIRIEKHRKQAEKNKI